MATKHAIIIQLTNNINMLHWSAPTKTIWILSGGSHQWCSPVPSSSTFKHPPPVRREIIQSPWCSCYHLGWGGACRFSLSACQGCWSCTVLIMQQPELRQDDCRPDRKWREIMIGQPAVCLPSPHCSYPRDAKLALIDLTARDQQVRVLTALDSQTSCKTAGLVMEAPPTQAGCFISEPPSLMTL